MATGGNFILGKDNVATTATTLGTTSATGGIRYAALDVTTSDNQAIWGVSVVAAANPSAWLNYAGVMGSGAVGVCGETGHDGGVGVLGESRGRLDATGVMGLSEKFGVFGISRRGVGVYGHSDNWTGVVGSTNNSSNFAGYFWGAVGISGNLTLWGKKSAAVPFPDGSFRLLYSVESPENWFEDFGVSRLVRGRVRVKLDRRFASVVRLTAYHVFLTPEGDSRGLYVSAKTKDGFEVREQQRGLSNVRFSYRIVALRKDVTARRFERAVLPKRSTIPSLAAVQDGRPISRRMRTGKRARKAGRDI